MYADIIIDIQTQKLDRVFEYRIPEDLCDRVKVGTQVCIPFGANDAQKFGYVVGIHPEKTFSGATVKNIISVKDSSLDAEAELVRLAAWMSSYYGSTFLQAIKTVLPVKTVIRQNVRRKYHCGLDPEQREAKILQYKKDKRFMSRVRTLEAFRDLEEISSDILERELRLSASTIKSMVKSGDLVETEDVIYRNRTYDVSGLSGSVPLNEKQTAIRDSIITAFDSGDHMPSCIHGITGSGKTNLYISLAKEMIRRKRQVIMLIPEISLTSQTVMRFYRVFGERVSFVHSRLSAGERYDQFLRARNGEIDIMIGPRSALFTPFSDLGMILIDEEHDSAYRSEITPRYDTFETACKRCEFSAALVVCGSATPSLRTYYAAKEGRIHLYEMKERAVSGSSLAVPSVVDMREELKRKNRSIFSLELQEAIREALANREQVMLFLNRRGYAGFVSCRNCGNVFRCPHCDISLTSHRNGKLICHYCGFETVQPKNCPECGSIHIAGFGLGTEKVDSAVAEIFPGARTLIMDRDTTSKKNSMDEILLKFSMGEADILIGTQMIVKGHDFNNVTVMGIIAADMTLNLGDYRSAERTFQLITQAAGRSGRGSKRGKVIIQTYQPDHYVIENAAAQDYEKFYAKEIMYRKILRYPPCSHMLEIILYSQDETICSGLAYQCKEIGLSIIGRNGSVLYNENTGIGKINDIYRRYIFCKADSRDCLVEIKDRLMKRFDEINPKNTWIQFDFQS